jgi:hypothetical protein
MIADLGLRIFRIGASGRLFRFYLGEAGVVGEQAFAPVRPFSIGSPGGFHLEDP